jgi:C4-dicarboxylate-specific signal transduction histidine kinase
MLVHRAAAVASSDTGKITIRTERRTGKCVFHVEDDGPALAEDVLAGIFETARAAEQDDMVLPICQLLARRLRGSIRAANRQEGGLCITVELASP